MASNQQGQGPAWYDAQFYPDSLVGYCYIIVLDQPYIGGAKRVRIGGHYEMIEGKKRLIGGELQERPQMVYTYVGWSLDPWKRYDQHIAGRGARILAYLASIGVSMTLAVVTPGGRDLEARLKRRHNGAGLLRSISATYANIGL